MNKQQKFRFLASIGYGIFLIGWIGSSPSSLHGQRKEELSERSNGFSDFRDRIRPLLEKACFKCHGHANPEGDIDLQSWSDPTAVRKDIPNLVKVRSVLHSQQMPPPDSKLLKEEERKILVRWSDTLLRGIARQFAGDPGPVGLRRLSNAEYNYSVQDLTGLEGLDPTREFPVDGAAGEGFTNAANALSMSPSLFQKYIDAAKRISDHAMLLDDRIEFTRETTRRDRIDLLIKRIQNFYESYTTEEHRETINVGGVPVVRENSGRIPLHRYLLATIENRDALRTGKVTIQQVASENGLSSLYLNRLWRTLDRPDDDSFLLNQVRTSWRHSNPQDVPELTKQIRSWQHRLWKFNPVGHIGRPGGPKSWQQPIDPIQNNPEFAVKIAKDAGGENKNARLVLSSELLTPETPGFVHWKRPRIRDHSGREVLLRDIQSLTQRADAFGKEFLGATVVYLQAVDEYQKQLQKSAQEPKQLAQILAQKHKLNQAALRAWLELLSIPSYQRPSITGHFTQKITRTDGHDFINGWGSTKTPLVLANASDKQVRIPGIARPRQIVVHPSPTHFAAVGWVSPITGDIELNAAIADHHPECGNGVEWRLVHQGQTGSTVLWKGDFGIGGKQSSGQLTLRVRKADIVVFYVGPRSGNHVCDLTEINLTLRSPSKKLTWDLAGECSQRILDSNPLGDSQGNPAVWHFVTGNWKDLLSRLRAESRIPPGSLLAEWLKETDSQKRSMLAQKIADILQSGTDLTGPNQAMREAVGKLVSPFEQAGFHMDLKPDPRFGHPPKGTPETEFSDQDLFVPLGKSLSFDIPTELVNGRTIILTGEIRAPSGFPTALVHAGLAKAALDRDLAITTVNRPEATEQARRACNDFRDIFPAAVCYHRIIPVDEVVTLTLYFREDRLLRELFLSPAESARLDGLWRDLIYVSQEPLQKVVALEQIYQFATQDRPDLVKEFKTMFAATGQRAERFRQRLEKSESKHLAAVHQLASRAWRQPIDGNRKAHLNRLHAKLVADGIDHDQAIRLLIARVLSSPSFLYRYESVKPGTGISQISDRELATRLSYFLWSSIPDRELSVVADQYKLHSRQVLRGQCVRMLKSDRVRRLAIHFACQWLHVRDFDQMVEKNERLFPEFDSIKKDMYEESVRFFENLFRNNESVLDILDADYTFLNPRLANHYGIPAKTKGWARVAGVRKQGRGGVLGMASILASQSGASRSSAILRGNWVSETLLGERLPKPPSGVPQLPESVPQGLTARELIEKHSSVPGCAKCHARIDPYGFALEQFDTLGRTRPDKIDTRATLIDQTEIEGLAGLKHYLVNKRREDVLRQFCRKLLGYALGRETRLSDEPLIDKMLDGLKQNEFRVHSAVLTIVNSRQFRSVRQLDYPSYND